MTMVILDAIINYCIVLMLATSLCDKVMTFVDLQRVVCSDQLTRTGYRSY